MKIEIHSFESIVEKAESPWECRVAVISIGDNGDQPPAFKYNPQYFLRLEFEDIAPDELDEIGVNPDHMFKDEQAQEIAEFVYGCKDNIDLLICQCEYGQSRSAGCAAAISEHFYGNGIDIFADDRYYPNKLVFRKVLNALNNLKKQ